MPSRLIIPTSGSGGIGSFLTPSDTLQLQATTERSSTAMTWTAIKRFRFANSGNILLKFDMKGTYNKKFHIAFYPFYTNFNYNTHQWLPYYVEWVGGGTGSYSTFYCILPVYGIDLCLWLKCLDYDSEIFVKNCKIYFDTIQNSVNEVITD